MPAAAPLLPWVSLGLGVYQMTQAQRAQQQAIEAARQPRLSAEQQATIRKEGTSNINASLAARGLGESSLVPGAYANLEKKIAEATANAGTAGDVSSLYANQALGLGQSGSSLIGNFADAFLMRKLLGDQNQTQSVYTAPTPTQNLPWSNPYQPIYYPSMYTPGQPLQPGLY